MEWWKQWSSCKEGRLNGELELELNSRAPALIARTFILSWHGATLPLPAPLDVFQALNIISTLMGSAWHGTNSLSIAGVTSRNIFQKMWVTGLKQDAHGDCLFLHLIFLLLFYLSIFLVNLITNQKERDWWNNPVDRELALGMVEQGLIPSI